MLLSWSPGHQSTQTSILLYSFLSLGSILVVTNNKYLPFFCFKLTRTHYLIMLTWSSVIPDTCSSALSPLSLPTPERRASDLQQTYAFLLFLSLVNSHMFIISSCSPGHQSLQTPIQSPFSPVSDLQQTSACTWDIFSLPVVLSEISGMQKDLLRVCAMA